MFGKFRPAGGGGAPASGFTLGSIVFEGDSITFGFGTTTPWVPIVLSSIPTATGTLVAQNGSRLKGDATNPAIIMRVDASLRANYNPRAMNVVWCLAGCNDLADASSSAVDVHAALRDFSLRAREMGYRVVVATILPRSDYSGAEQTEWNSCNTLIRNNYTSYADVLCDLQADPTIGPFAASSNTTYYSDGIHPTNLTATTIIAPLARTAISAALAMTPVTRPTLWTPYNASPPPRWHIDARDAVWNGSNLASIISRGGEAGALTVAGTVTKGTAVNGIDPILTDAGTERLQQTLAVWGASGKFAFFGFGKLNNLATNGWISRAWNTGQNDTVVIYAALNGGGHIFDLNRDGAVDHFPQSGTATNVIFPDTTGYHSLYDQGGSTNVIYGDGTAKVRNNASIPDTTGTVPNYPVSVWTCGSGSPTNNTESFEGNTITAAIFDSFLTQDEYQKWEAYYAWLTNQTSILPASNPWKNSPPTV